MSRTLAVLLVCLSSSLVGAADFQATLDWLKPSTLGTTVSGMIVEVKAQKGQVARKGELLVRLDERDTKARLDSARAAYIESRALYEEASREEERALELYDRTLLSDHELKLAQIDRTRAVAVMEQAAARQTLAEVELERTAVKAPYDGLVREVHVVAGQMILNRVSMQPLVSLVPVGEMRALAAADSKQLEKIRVGMSAQVAVGGDWIEGRVTDINPDKEGSGLVEVVFPVSGATASPGQAVTIRLKD